MGAFDDLIPQGNALGSGAFDDLIPGAKIPKSENILQRALKIGANIMPGPLGPVARDVVNNGPGGFSSQAGIGFADTATFGAPSLIAKTAGTNLPEPSGFEGSLGRKGGELAGFVVGGPMRIAGNLAKKATIPLVAKGASGLGGRLVRKGLVSGAEMGAARASLSPSKLMSGDSSLGQEAAEIGGTALLSGVSPFIGRGTKRVFKNVVSAFKAPKKLEKVRSELPKAESELTSAQMDQQAQIPQFADESSRGIRVVKKAGENLVNDLEKSKEEITKLSRNKIVSQVKGVKEKISKYEQDFYKTYDDVLERGEAEAAQQGLSGANYFDDVISPTLERINESGAQTTAAKRLMSKFGEDVEEKAIPETIEQMKNLKNSLGKYGQGDDITNYYNELHRNFIGKYSPSVSKANESYGEVKNALKFAKKSIAHRNPQEISKTADLLMKEARGKLSETEAAYLKTLKQGKGEFSGSGELLDKTTKDAVSKAEKEIDDIQRQINSIKEGTAKDISTLKQAKSQSKYEYDVSGKKQSELFRQNVLTKKGKVGELQKLEKELEDKITFRNRILLGAGISALSIAGLFKFIPLAREISLISRQSND